MTILIGWIGVDQRGPCSGYLLSDSRLSWDGYKNKYDYGRKLFSFVNSADIIGYCGEVLFASQTLSQIVTLADNNLLFPGNSKSVIRSDAILSQINIQFSSYPFKEPLSRIIHLSRDLDRKFKIYEYQYSSSEKIWKRNGVEFCDSKSSIFYINGTGRIEFENMYRKYQEGDLSNTSRNIFQCFCSFLKKYDTMDISFGGAPQLVGLYNGSKFNGMNYGVIYKESRWFLGSPVKNGLSVSSIRWYNENFEICDGHSMLRMKNAMIQPNPNL